MQDYSYKTKEINIKKYKIIRSCGACPEQYDIILNNKFIAFIRLRHGILTCENPEQTKIYYKDNINYDGSFWDNKKDRELFINKIIKKLEGIEL